MNIRKISLQNKGFTLVELLIAIVLLSVILVFLILFINPFAQLNKAKDAQRKKDLAEIRSALDLYFNDHNCYPASIPFGFEWTEGSVTYMKKVPQDPDCSPTRLCYYYQVDTTATCSQWNVLYAKLSIRPTNTEEYCKNTLKTACDNSSLSVNLKYSDGYCILSGQPDCIYIGNNTNFNLPATLPEDPQPPPPSCNNHYYAFVGGACNDIGADSANLCTFHGGAYTCYSGGAAVPNGPCQGIICSQ